jgi:hypothetical protein
MGLLFRLLLLLSALLGGRRAETNAGNAEATIDVMRELQRLMLRVDNSWTHSLNQEQAQVQEEQQQQQQHPRHRLRDDMAREVRDGHYVLVDPKPLPDPILVAVEPEVCGELLGLTLEACSSDAFVDIVSGGVSGWATPYALSIYGRPIIPEGAGPNGDGYGDGRAISIAEIRLDESLEQHQRKGVGAEWQHPRRPRRLELQLKGAGRTPFCRTYVCLCLPYF